MLTALVGTSLTAAPAAGATHRPPALHEEARGVVTRVTTGHVGFPDVGRRPDGDLVVVYRAGRRHADPSGHLVYQRGSADGAHWSSPKLLVQTPGVDERDPSVRFLAGGDIVVTCFRYVRAERRGNTVIVHHIFFARGPDIAHLGPWTQVDGHGVSTAGLVLAADGRWRDSEKAAVVVHATTSDVVQMGHALVVPAYGGPTLDLKDLAHSPRSRLSLFESADGGHSWREQPVAVPLPLARWWLQEPALLGLGGGELLLQARTARGASPVSAGPLVQLRSHDGGKTWGDLHSFGFVGHAPDLLRLQDSTIVSAFREVSPDLSHAWVSLMTSRDAGRTWSAPLRIADCGAADCGYPSLVALPKHRLLVVYYAEGGHSIDAVIYGDSGALSAKH